MSDDTPDLTPEQVDALADADFREKVRAELRRLRDNHRQFQVALMRAEERVRQYNNLLDSLHAFAINEMSDEAWDAYHFVSAKAIAAVEAVWQAEEDLHHATVAINCLERNGYGVEDDLIDARAAVDKGTPSWALVDDCPF